MTPTVLTMLCLLVCLLDPESDQFLCDMGLASVQRSSSTLSSSSLPAAASGLSTSPPTTTAGLPSSNSSGSLNTVERERYFYSSVNVADHTSLPPLLGKMVITTNYVAYESKVRSIHIAALL